MQHLLAVYLPVFGSPRFFWDVDSRTARLGRAALVRWGPSRFLGGSIVSTGDWCFHWCRAATVFSQPSAVTLSCWSHRQDLWLSAQPVQPLPGVHGRRVPLARLLPRNGPPQWLL
jgi:hypothetical protein